MNNDNWIRQLSDKVTDTPSPVPDDLWRDIEVKLDSQPTVRRKARLRALYRWTAVAACVALLFGVGISLLHTPSVLPADVAVPAGGSREVANAASASASVATTEASTPASSALVAQSRQSTDASPIYNKENASASSASCAVASETAVMALSDVPSEAVQSSDTSAHQQQTTHKIPKAKKIHSEATYPSRNLDPQFGVSHTAKNKGWSASLYASNVVSGSMGNSTTSAPVLAVMSSNMLLDAANTDVLVASKLPRYVEDASEKVDHKPAVGFGLSVKYHLTPRWALSSGLVYTLLRSDFTHKSGNNSIVDRQTLHYIGVPLKAEYRVLHLGGLSVYATAGGEVDKNVKAQVSTDGTSRDLSKDRLQWSADLSAGVQYDFIPQLGVYVEPGARYYFNNHSPIENTFKDKPWNFNLQLGLRWNLNR